MLPLVQMCWAVTYCFIDMYLTEMFAESVVEKVDTSKVVHDFVDWVYNELEIDAEKPEFEFSSKKADPDQHNTGWYNNETNTMWVYTYHRNLIDILRTIAHELAHRKQGAQGRIHGGTYPGHPLEQEADAIAGYLIKVYGEQHPEIMQ